MSILTACVNVDPKTDKVIPREHQHYFFSEVEKKAKGLKLGMTKRQVLFLLGSAAEQEHHGNIWLYLPERIGVIIPARALQLEFENGQLVKHAYHAIILGQQL